MTNLDRRQFLGCLAAAVPSGSLFRFAIHKTLPQAKEFSLYRHGVKASEAERLMTVLQCFNSRPWRGERPESIQCRAYAFQPNEAGTWDFRFDFVRRPYPRHLIYAYGGWQSLDIRIYPVLDFNEFDFGELLPG